MAAREQVRRVDEEDAEISGSRFYRNLQAITDVDFSSDERGPLQGFEDLV